MSARAVIYCRVSTADQGEHGTSLDSQEALCRAYCEERGYQVIGVFPDVFTGAQYRDRPALDRLREQVRARTVDLVVAYAVDRLSRNQAHLYILVEEFEDHGARLEFVTEDFEDSAVGRFLRSAKAFAAEVEREKLAERSVRGRRATIAAGKPHRGPYPLYGYQWIETGDGLRLVPDPTTAPVVERIYDRYLAGGTLRGICQELTDAGVPGPQGNRWYPQAVRRVLSHPNYTGTGYGWFNRRGGYDMSEAIALPDGIIAPLVSQTDWDAVQARLQINRERASRNNSNPEATLLRGGFVRCGHCGHAMSVDRQKGKYRYRCASSHLLREGRCHVSIQADTLDQAVWQRIEGVLTNPETALAEIERFHGTDGATAERERLERQVRAIETRQNRLVQAISMLPDADDVAPLTVRLGQLGEARRALQDELASLTGQTAQADALRATLATFSDWQADLREHLPDLPYEQKRALLDLFAVAVEVFPLKHKPRYVITGSIHLERFVKRSSSIAFHNTPIHLRWLDAADD